MLAVSWNGRDQVAIKTPTSPSTAAHLHMQTHYARRIMRTCFITAVRITPVQRRTPCIKLIIRRTINFLMLVESAFAAQFLYYLQAFTVFLSFFPWSRVLGKQNGPESHIPPVLWNSTGSLLHPQKPITCRCVNRDQASPTDLILSFHLYLGLPCFHFNSDFPTKTLYVPLLSPTRDTCPPISFLI